MESISITNVRSNPKATIGFVIYYPFQFYVYKNVYKELIHDAEFIIDCGIFHPSEAIGESILEAIVRLLEENNCAYRVLTYNDYKYRLYLESFFKKYTCLISVWERGCMMLEATQNIVKINTTYGAGKELNTVRPSRAIYDLILAYGKRDAALFSYYTNVEIVGNPRFDDWFTNTVDMSSVRTLRQKLDKEKKTILYLPTHGDLSSIDYLAKDLYRLGGSFNVIAKTHYYTTREEPDRVKKLTNEKILLLEDDIDQLPLLALADVVLSDNSSAIFDAILADKPLLVSDYLSKEYLDEDHKELKKTLRGLQGAATYSESIEQIIKRDGRVHTLKEGDLLEEKIEEVLKDNLFDKNNRQNLRNELFSYTDGTAAKRAAEAIKTQIQKGTLQTRPILFHAFEAYKRRARTLSFARERRLLQELKQYKSYFSEEVRNENTSFYSVILVFSENSSEENFSSSIRALIEQDFPSSQYEIFVVGAPEEYGMPIVQGISLSGKLLPNITFISERGARGINTAVESSQGSIVCFTDSMHFVPSHWLAQLHLAYHQFSNSAGVGGYAIVKKKNYTLYDECSYYELAKRLGIEKEAAFLSKIYAVTNSVFSQNPAGSLSNMSYKKDLLPLIPPTVNELTMIGTYFKAMVIKDENITFLPLAVSRQEPINLRTFLSNVKTHAFATAVIGRRTAQFAGTKHFLQLFSEPIRALLRYRKAFAWKKAITFSALVFLSSLYEWLGGVTASAQFFKYNFYQVLNEAVMLTKSDRNP